MVAAFAYWAAPRDGGGPYRKAPLTLPEFPPKRGPTRRGFGHRTQVRIALDKILSPKAFVLFMAKCHFPEAWSASDDVVGVPNDLDRRLENEKSACVALEEEHFGDLERGEPFLT